MKHQLSKKEIEYITWLKAVHVDTLYNCIKSDIFLLRKYAAIELAKRKDKGAVGYCIKLCGDINYKMREIGAYTLGLIPLVKKENLGYLIQRQGTLLSNKAVTGNLSTIKKVVNLLQHLALEDKSARVRSEAILSLGKRYIYDDTISDRLISVLGIASTDKAVSVRLATAEVAVYMRDTNIVLILERLLTDEDSDVRSWAALAANASAVDSQKIRKACLRLTKDDFDEVRIEAIAYLAQKRDKRVACSLMKEMSQDGYKEVIVQAAASLGDLRFIPVLENLLIRFDDPDGLIQNSLDKLKAAQPCGDAHHFPL